jgi:hypothetical protein
LAYMAYTLGLVTYTPEGNSNHSTYYPLQGVLK